MQEWAFWVTVIGLPEEMFWECTPREMFKIFDEFFSWQDVHGQRFGAVAAAAWNAMRANKKRDSWRSWKDFITPFRKENRSRGLKREDILAQVQDMRKQYYGWKQ